MLRPELAWICRAAQRSSCSSEKPGCGRVFPHLTRAHAGYGRACSGDSFECIRNLFLQCCQNRAGVLGQLPKVSTGMGPCAQLLPTWQLSRAFGCAGGGLRRQPMAVREAA
ncbi:hypothetical protein NDU88_004773 [Pleurodeles waltl]|uniref:Anaphylatoxin-like domain-containing protein n=1 Tax=Pleurodeles waltl TaxID=8319 RepID=A0AAV7QG51_PLEWA|nr:hypothetical protein NDU88_004773 [Pleurodeles waltl]